MRREISARFGAALFIAACLMVAMSSASADLLCIKKRLRSNSGAISHSSALKVSSVTCPRGYVELLNTTEFKGADGAVGQDGADATTLLYGTGSAGDLTVASGTTTLDDANLNYQNISIASGATLNVRPGTVIRCTGTFTNAGTITIYTHASGGLQALPGSATITQRFRSPSPSGMILRAAGNGECGTDAGTVSGGYGGNSGFGLASVLNSRLSRFGAAGGGGGGSSSVYEGGEGGGVAYIVCQGAISNSGSITADGEDGGFGAGGGGGGLIILGSPTSIVNTGSITAIGGDGGASDTSRGAGGGAAGGAIFLISPSITAGSTSVAGGAAGDDTTNITANPRCGGGGGAPSLSFGGNGGSVAAAGTANAASSGQAGSVGSLAEDPAEVLLNL